MTIKEHIRFAEIRDVHQIIELCALHAEFEKSDYGKDGKAERLKTDLFSDEPNLYCLVVESEDQLIGYATFMKQYSTWETNEYIYMDCLYLKTFARGLGIGEKLVKRIQEEGKKLGCNLLQWQTPDFNVKAIAFYKRLGAVSKPKQRFFLKKP
ncbi:MAG: GNAT family N-acetyltransferase [Aurantibacter sp.]